MQIARCVGRPRCPATSGLGAGDFGYGNVPGQEAAAYVQGEMLLVGPQYTSNV